ncbi:MAG: homoserine kinase [Holophagaceae bacterium]|nr:homoserine kinase [Holophagaceae bacterium]
MSLTIRAYAPASIGNFAAGFDLMGAALAPLDGSLWGDVVGAKKASTTTLLATGPYAHLMPPDPTQNLVLRTFAFVKDALATKDIPCPEMAFTLEKNLPRSSGLGSSASSIVATLVACQILLGEPFTRSELLQMAGRAESLVSGSVHLDNVAPSLHGGLLLLVPGEGGSSKPRALPWPSELVIAVVHPHCELSTEKARHVMPNQLPMAEVLAFAQNLAAFVHALHTKDQEIFVRCLRDVLAEPRRAELVPGFRAAQKAAMRAGALGCSLSGSGPSIFAVAEGTEHGEKVAAAIQEAFNTVGLASEARLCGVDPLGARVLP